MSHFAVAVIGSDVDALMAPYHEFECTGTIDQYVVNVDQMPETLEKWKNETTTRRFNMATGESFNPYDDQFYREPTEQEIADHPNMMGSGFSDGIHYSSKDWGDGRGYRAKVHFMPEGYEDRDTPNSDVFSFLDFCVEYHSYPIIAEGEQPDLSETHKWGWIRVNDKNEVIELIRRTNPQKQWDWWVIGGRWSNMLILKDGSKADSALVKDIDLDAMYASGRDEALKLWDDMQAARQDYARRAMTSNLSRILDLDDENEGSTVPFPEIEKWVSWQDAMAQFDKNIEKAREFYHAQNALIAMKETEFGKRAFFFEWDRLMTPREDYGHQAGVNSICTYALIKDGQWYSRGKMGWWGMSSDDMTLAEWGEKQWETYRSLPGDERITIVDCHI